MTVHSSAEVHPAAVIEPGAEIGAGCRIGPFALVGPKVRLGAGCVLHAHAVVTGRTKLGEGCEIHPFAVVGGAPQDLKYAGEDTELVIGARNRNREGATLSLGTAHGGGITRMGDDCLMMTGAHVGHDCDIGSRVIMANNVAIAGHVRIEDDVILGGLVGVHQWCRVGRGAIIGALSAVAHDVIPYALVQGPRPGVEGVNLIGLKRRGAAREDIRALRDAFRRLAADEGAFADRARALQGSGSAEVEEVVAFILGDSDRSFIVPR